MSTTVTVKLTVDQLDKARRLFNNYERKLSQEREEAVFGPAKLPVTHEHVKGIDRELHTIDQLKQVFS